MSNDLVQGNVQGLAEAAISKEVALGLKQYLKSGDAAEETKLLGILNKNKSLLDRFFKTEEQRQIERFALEDLRRLRDNKAEIIRVHHDLYIHTAELQANAILKAAGVHYQKELAVFAISEIDSMTKTIRDSQKIMTAQFAQDQEEAEQLYRSNEKFLSHAIKLIDKAMAIHMETTETLLDDAVKALKGKALIEK